MTDSTTTKNSSESPAHDWYDRPYSESHPTPLGPLTFDSWRDATVPVDQSDEARRFAAERGLTTGPFVRMGCRVGAWQAPLRLSPADAGQVLWYPSTAGLKCRRMDNGAKRSMGAFRDHPLNVFYGSDPYARVLVAESETDAAALLTLYPEADVAVAPLGARTWAPIWTAQLALYPAVYVAYDADEAGEEGAAKVCAALPQAVRHAPPDGKDWAAWCHDNHDKSAPALEGRFEADLCCCGHLVNDPDNNNTDLLKIPGRVVVIRPDRGPTTMTSRPTAAPPITIRRGRS